jgi:serine/threonine protein kinase
MFLNKHVCSSKSHLLEGSAPYGIAFLLQHRDLKPANNLLGANRTIEIADFRLTRRLGTTEETHTIVGTVGGLLAHARLFDCLKLN